MLAAFIKASLFLVFLMGCLADTAYSGDAPKFTDYPASVYSGPTAKVRLNTPQARNMRTRLREGVQRGINFAGHYILVQWGCGEACQTGAIVNAKNGEVLFLPHSVCCWRKADAPFYYKQNSRLLVLGGMLDSKEPLGAHFFEFDGSSLRYITTRVPIDDNQTVAEAPVDQRIDGKTFRFKLCNKINTNINAAFGYRAAAHAPDFFIHGWFAVKPKRCEIFGPFYKGDFLFTVTSDIGHIWGKGVRLCVEMGPFKKLYISGQSCENGVTTPFFHLFVLKDLETANMGETR